MKINQATLLSMVIGLTMCAPSALFADASSIQFNMVLGATSTRVQAVLADIDAKIAAAGTYEAKLATLGTPFQQADAKVPVVGVKAHYNYETAPAFNHAITAVTQKVNSVLTKLEAQVAAETDPLTDLKLATIDTFHKELSKAIVLPFVKMDNETKISDLFRGQAADHSAGRDANQICPTVDALFARIERCKTTIRANNEAKANELAERKRRQRGETGAVAKAVVAAAKAVEKQTEKSQKPTDVKASLTTLLFV